MKQNSGPAIVIREMGTNRTMKKQPSKTLAAVAEKTVRRRIPKWALQSGETPSTDQQYHLRTIGRALDVLDCFDGQVPLSLKDISARVDLPETSLFRVLLTLETHKY